MSCFPPAGSRKHRPCGWSGWPAPGKRHCRSTSTTPLCQFCQLFGGEQSAVHDVPLRVGGHGLVRIAGVRGVPEDVGRRPPGDIGGVGAALDGAIKGTPAGRRRRRHRLGDVAGVVGRPAGRWQWSRSIADFGRRWSTCSRRDKTATSCCRYCSRWPPDRRTATGPIMPVGTIAE